MNEDEFQQTVMNELKMRELQAHEKPNFILFRMVNSYGNERIYPVCERATMLTELTGRKTVHRSDLEIMRDLGYAVRVMK